METKKQEVKFATSDIKQMIGNYTAEVVKRKWVEDFVDESTGQVVSVDRYEKILDKGVLIDKEKASSLNFYLQSGDISEVVVSNQCRKGDFSINNHPYSFAVTISRRENFTEKNTKLLLMAESTDMATEIVKDFAELKYDGLFWIKEIKQVGSILLKDTLKKVDKSIEYLNDNIDMKNQLIECNINKAGLIVYGSNEETKCYTSKDIGAAGINVYAQPLCKYKVSKDEELKLLRLLGLRVWKLKQKLSNIKNVKLRKTNEEKSKLQ